jgi:hypothetical protein
VQDGHDPKLRVLELEHEAQRMEDEGLAGRGIGLTAMRFDSKCDRILDAASAHDEIVRTAARDLPIRALLGI